MGLKIGTSSFWRHAGWQSCWQNPGHLCSCQRTACIAHANGEQLQTTTGKRGLCKTEGGWALKKIQNTSFKVLWKTEPQWIRCCAGFICIFFFNQEVHNWNLSEIHYCNPEWHHFKQVWRGVAGTTTCIRQASNRDPKRKVHENKEGHVKAKPGIFLHTF